MPQPRVTLSQPPVVLGKGNFGAVLGGHLLDTGVAVAVKQVAIKPQCGVPGMLVREVSCLQVCGAHPNVVQFMGCLLTPGPAPSLLIVMERAREDLHAYLDRTGRARTSERDAKILGFMLARGVAACHSSGVLHRDIKPRNCVLTDGGELKLADFGAARHGSLLPPLSLVHGSLWYRAPELLLPQPNQAQQATTWYAYEIDCWALGCVIGELAQGVAPFHERSAEDQWGAIALALAPELVVGAVEAVDSAAWDRGAKQRRKMVQKMVQKLLPRFSTAFRTLATSLLCVDPATRATAREVCTHAWFGALAKLSDDVEVCSSKAGKLSKRVLGQ